MRPVEDIDPRWMAKALELAARGVGLVEPNPAVGAVVVRNGEMVGSGFHARFGGDHAEIAALREAGERAQGATLYVSLEPCCHHGKTPPCTDAILRSGIERVVAAIRDPFPRVDGGGLRILRGAGIPVVVGLLAEAAVEMNAPYFKRVLTGRPYVTAKWAMTLDGKAACSGGGSQWISSEASRSLVHQLRGRMDAIIVGIGTVLADDPLLTARPPGPRVAARIILDSLAATPLHSRLVRSAHDAPVIVVVSSNAPAARLRSLEDQGCEILCLSGSHRIPIPGLLEILGSRMMTNVLVEGGGRVLGSFFDEGEVDAVETYIAPMIEGGDHATTPARGRGVIAMHHALRLQEVRFEEVGGDLRIRASCPRDWRREAGQLALDPATPSTLTAQIDGK